MKKITHRWRVIIGIALAVITGTIPAAFAATNTALNSLGGGVTLTDSGVVTVNSSALLLVKQVYDNAGLCLASSPADATCNGGATSVTVAAGSTLKFLIFIKNTSDVAVADVRFTDLLDTSATGFTYSAGSIKRTANDGTAPADSASAAVIYAAANAGTVQTDLLGAPDDLASFVGSTLAVGAVTGQVNQSLGFFAHKSLGVVFTVVKK